MEKYQLKRLKSLAVALVTVLALTLVVSLIESSMTPQPLVLAMRQAPLDEFQMQWDRHRDIMDGQTLDTLTAPATTTPLPTRSTPATRTRSTPEAHTIPVDHAAAAVIFSKTRTA